MNYDNLSSVFQEQLIDMYNSQKQLVNMLLLMEESASSQKLKASFKRHLDFAESELEMICHLFECLEIKPSPVPCKYMENLVLETRGVMVKSIDPHARDLALVGLVEKAHRHKIASYVNLRTWAQVFDNKSIENTLQELLTNELNNYEAIDELSSISRKDNASL